MSLESALEEERLGVLHILEEAQNRSRSRSGHSSPAPGQARRGSVPSNSMLLPEEPAAPRKSSMLLAADEVNHLRPVATANVASLRPNRSLSSSASNTLRPVRSTSDKTAAASYFSLDDPTTSGIASAADPNANSESFYYDPKTLRANLPANFMTKREREEADRAKAASKFAFWKKPQDVPSRSPSREPSRERSPSAGPDTSKLRLSQNASLFSSSATSSPMLKPSTDGLTPLRSGDSGSPAPPHPRSASTASTMGYLDGFGLSSVKVDLDAIQAPKPVTSASRRRSSAASKSDFKNEFDDMYKGVASSRRLVDDDDLEEEYSEDDETGTSSEDDSDSDEENDDDDDDDDDDVEDTKKGRRKKRDLDGLNANIVKGQTETLISAMEEERKSIETSKFRVKSLIDEAPGVVPPPSMAEYAAYKRRIIHPHTAFDKNLLEDTPYTSDTEELLDARRAAKLPFEISTIHSSLTTKRMIRTISRGENLPSLTDPNAPVPTTYVLGTDLSPEAAHALEWTIGTVLRDSNVLYVVCANEDELLNDKSSTVTPQQQEEDRLDAITQLTTTISKLLKKTRLQIHVVIEVVHCKSPKHLLTAVIDHVMPAMVILGSRGRSALKGVLLGSFSNYIVERSAVPVMVARRKLHKTKHRDLNVRLANNLRSQGGLSSAIVD